MKPKFKQQPTPYQRQIIDMLNIHGSAKIIIVKKGQSIGLSCEPCTYIPTKDIKC